MADTILVETGTNKQVAAKDHPGLQHHFPLHTSSPQQPHNQPQPGQTSQQPYQPQPGQTVHQPYQPGGQQQQGQPGYNPYKNPPNPYQSSQPHQSGPYVGPAKSKVTAAVLAFVLGPLGIHRFYLGYTQTAIAMLAISILGNCLFCGLGLLVTGVWAIYDAIMILTDKMPDSTGRPLE